MADGHGGITIGSEISGGAKNIFAENCVMTSAALNQPLRIKTSSARGGVIENVFVRNITAKYAREEAIIMTMFYEDKGNSMPTIRNVQIKNMVVEKAGKRGVVLEGYAESPITNIRLTDVKINGVAMPSKLLNVKNISWINTFINGQKVQ